MAESISGSRRLDIHMLEHTSYSKVVGLSQEFFKSPPGGSRARSEGDLERIRVEINEGLK